MAVAGQIWYGGTYTSLVFGTYPLVQCFDGATTYTYYLSQVANPQPGNTGVARQWATIGMYNAISGSTVYCWGPGCWLSGTWYCCIGVTSPPPLLFFSVASVGRSGTVDKEQIVLPGTGLCIWYAPSSQWYYPNVHAQTAI